MGSFSVLLFSCPANVMDSAVVENILHSANAVLPIKECIFIGDKGYNAKAVYNL